MTWRGACTGIFCNEAPTRQPIAQIAALARSIRIIYNNIDSNKGSIYMSVFASDQRSPQVKLSLEPFYSCRLQSLTVLLFFSQVCITDLYYCINQLRTINLGLGKLLIEMDHIRHALLLVYQCFLGLRRKCLST